jgi:glycosyltransferase involved in cell wall biosynthesis
MLGVSQELSNLVPGTPRRKVLVSAFACEPGRGSEPGIGWNWATQAARFNEVWVLTHTSHRRQIEAHMEQSPIDNLHFEYVKSSARTDASGLAGLLLRFQYILWQAAALRAAKRLHAEVQFDIAHHVTYGSYRYPTFLARLGVPFVWGPMGGGERAPISFYRTYGWKGILFESIRDLSNLVAKVDPVVHLTARRAAKIIAVTPDTASALPRSAQSKIVIEPAIGMYENFMQIPFHGTGNGIVRLIYAGMLLHRKGVHLLLPALKKAIDQGAKVRLDIVGNGPMKKELEQLTIALGLNESVSFIGQMPRERLVEYYREHDIFAFPSLQDSGGFVVIEAMAAGLPVICLGLGGPGQIVTDQTGIRVPAKSPDQVVNDLAKAISTLAEKPERRREMGLAGRERIVARYSWDRIGNFTQRLYSAVHESTK